MATSLLLISNTKVKGKEDSKDWERMVRELDGLNMSTTSYVNAQNEVIKEYGTWRYEVQEEEDEIPFTVDFCGPFHIMPSLYTNICIMNTIYRYSLLYDNYAFEWFRSFRNDLFNIVKIMGGTEVIYLADNACDKLAFYLECMACENVPYEEIKEKMIQEFGQPVTDYSRLNIDELTYSRINEFFLDDFNDLKKLENK
jgi:hypothetical protein